MTLTTILSIIGIYTLIGMVGFGLGVFVLRQQMK